MSGQQHESLDNRVSARLLPIEQQLLKLKGTIHSLLHIDEQRVDLIEQLKAEKFQLQNVVDALTAQIAALKASTATEEDVANLVASHKVDYERATKAIELLVEEKWTLYERLDRIPQWIQAMYHARAEDVETRG